MAQGIQSLKAFPVSVMVSMTKCCQSILWSAFAFSCAPRIEPDDATAYF
jgi:hypothetical protein